MIFLDPDNLNILVLFILAFISFKGYQADTHLFDSESEEEFSQAEQMQPNHERVNAKSKSAEENSSQAENEQLKLEMKREEQKTDEILPDPSKMIGEENEDPSERLKSADIDPFNDKSISTAEQIPSLAENQAEKVEAKQQMDQEDFESYEHEIKPEGNSEFDSMSNDAESNEDDQKNPEYQISKIKKIKKAAKLIQKDLRRQQEMIKKLDEAIDRAIE